MFNVYCFPENNTDANFSSVGSDLSLGNKASRHVSIHIPTGDEVVRPSDSVTVFKRSPQLIHAHSISTIPNNLPAAGARTKSPTVASQRVDSANGVFSLPEEGGHSRLKHSKCTSSIPRLENKPRKSIAVCNNSLSAQSSTSSVDSTAENDVLSKVCRKFTATVLSRSDINRTLTSEIKRGRMSKDLAKLIISLSLSKDESESLPLPKTKVGELRSWILTPDSGCSKLPLSVQNHLNYIIQISDKNCSAIQKSRNLNRDTYSSAVNAPIKVFENWDRDNSKDGPTSSHTRFFLPKKTVQKRSGSVVVSRSYTTVSANSDEDITDTGHQSNAYRFRGTSSRPTARQGQTSDFKDQKRSSIKDLPSFVEQAHSVIKKINRTLQIRRMLRNSHFRMMHKPPTLRNSTSKFRTGLKQHKLQQSPLSTTTGEETLTCSNTTKMLSSQNFCGRSHLQNTAQQKTRKSLGSEFQSSVPNRSSWVTSRSSDTSLTSGEFISRCHVAPKKAPLKHFPLRCSGNKRTQNSTTFGLSRIPDSSASSLAVQKLSGVNSNVAAKQKHAQREKVRESVTSITSSDTSRNSKVTASVSPSNTSNKKPTANCSKVVAQRCQSSAKSLPSSTVHGSKLSSRWSDLGNWNGKVYTVKRVANSAKTSTTNSSHADKQHSKKSQLTSESESVGSGGKNRKPSTNTKQYYQEVSDKSSTETVVSRVSSTRSVTSGGHKASSVSSFTKTSPKFAVHLKIDNSDSKDIVFKRHVKKPSPDSASKGGVPRCKANSEKKVPQKRAPKTPKLAASSDVKSEASGISKTAPSDVVELSCSKATKRQETDQSALCGLSYADSIEANATFLAENTWHFGVPPQSLSESWSLAAIGSQSSIDKEDSRSDDTLSMGGDDDRQSCDVALLASFDRAVSTDSKPELSTLMLQTETHDQGREESSRCYESQPVQTISGPQYNYVTIPLRMSANANNNDDRPEHSFDADIDDTINNDLEDIHLEPFPPGLLSISTVDISVEVEPMYEYYKCTSVDRHISSLNSIGLYLVNNPSAENEAKTISDDNKNVGITGAKNCEVLQEQCKISQPSYKASATDSGNNLNETANSLVCSTNNNSPSSSDVSRKQSLKSPHTVRVLSCENLTCKTFRVSDNNMPLSRSSKFRFVNNLAACADSLHDISLLQGKLSSSISDERLTSLSSNRIRASDNDLDSAENEVKTISNVNKNVEKTSTGNWKVSQQQFEITKPGCEVIASDSDKHITENVNHFVCSTANSSPPLSDERKHSNENPDMMCLFSIDSLTSRVRSTVVSESHSSLSSPSNRFPSIQHYSSAACAGSSVPSPNQIRRKRLQPNANSRQCLLTQSHGHTDHDSSSKSDNEMETGASVLKPDDIKGTTLDLSGRRQVLKFKTDSGRFVNKPTLANSRFSPAKHVFDANMTKHEHDGHVAIRSSQSDTSHSGWTNNVSSNDRTTVARGVICDRQKPPMKPAGQLLSDSKTNVNALSESSSSIDYESLKAFVRNLVRDSSEEAQKPAIPATDNIIHLVPQLCSNDTRCGCSNSASSTSCESSQEPVKNACTHRSSDQVDSHISPKGEVPDCCDVNASTSSSHVIDLDTSAVESMPDYSTDMNTRSISYTSLSDTEVQDHAVCDMPSSSPTESASVISTSCDNNPQCISTSSGTSALRADSSPRCAAICRNICALNSDKRTTGTGICFDEIPNAVTDAFDTRLDRPVHRNAECHKWYQSVDDLPAKSRRLSTTCPATGFFATQSVSGFRHDKERNPRTIVSADMHRMTSKTYEDACMEENTNPCDISSDLVSSPRNNRCNDLSDDATLDGACSCGGTSHPRLYSLADVCQPKFKVKVNCKSSYGLKLRRRSRRVRRASPAKSSGETGSSDTDGDRICRSLLSQNFDSIQSMISSCQNVKRISYSQLYRMSRAGHSVNQRSPLFHSNNFCDTSFSSEDVDSSTNATAKSPALLHGNQDYDGNIEINAASLANDEDDVYNAETMSPARNVKPDEKAEAAAPVNQSTDEISPVNDVSEPLDEDEEDDETVMPTAENVNSNDQTYQTAAPTNETTDESLSKELVAEVEPGPAVSLEHIDSVDKAASHKTVDNIDVVDSCELLHQKQTLLGVSEMEWHDASGVYSTTLKHGNKTSISPSKPSTFEYIDDTASSPSMSFSLPTTDAISDDFLEVLSSRLLNAITKQQREAAASEELGVETAAKPHTKFLKTATGVATSGAADIVRPGTPARWSPPHSVQFDGIVCESLGRTHGVEGYLQRSEEAAANCTERSRHLVGAEVRHMKKVFNEHKTSGIGAATDTGHEVVICCLRCRVYVFRL